MFQALKNLWMLINKKADFKRTSEKFHVGIVVSRMLRNKDLLSDDEIQLYLYGSEKDLYSPWLLKDLEKAVPILEEKIIKQKKVRIIGDYDIDGVTSSFILYKGLKRLGLECSVRIPHRIEDGYGVNTVMIEEAAREGIDTILTCDNGIAAKKEFELAAQYGITVIVTDHHEVPYEMDKEIKRYILPPASAIINPAQEDCSYPNKKLCGAAVAMKLIFALYENAGIPEKEMKEFYELAAIATVGDVMDLQGENRILVKEGLKRLPNTSNIGLRELIRATGLQGKEITAYHIGFVLGPCINASGRLQTAEKALRLLKCTDQNEAKLLAEELVEINSERIRMTEQGVKDGEAVVETMMPVKQEIASWTGGIDRVLVVYLPDCHESLAGIIAGRLREKYSRPVFVLTDAKDGVKGSGRSIEEYSMYDELVKCREILDKFGGHPMAAGLSLQKEKIEEFRRMLNENCTLNEKDLRAKVRIDAELPFAMIDYDLVDELKLLEPYGKGNSKPVFLARNVQVSNVAVVGESRTTVRMRLSDQSHQTINAIYFRLADQFMQDLGNRRNIYAVLFSPDINEYNGKRYLQLIIQDYIMDK